MWYNWEHIIWYDSSKAPNWMSMKSVETWRGDKPLTINTVGYVIDETGDSITIAHSFSDANEVLGVLNIPKAVIIKRVNLSEDGQES